MKTPRRRRIEFEVLEAKALTSAGRPALPAAADVRIEQTTRPVVTLAGTIRGQYLVEPGDPRIPDEPPVYRLSGRGSVRPLGRVEATGGVFVGGFRPDPAPDNGTLTLGNARGSVTLQLEATIQGTPPGRPISVRASVREGTVPSPTCGASARGSSSSCRGRAGSPCA
jgi:hypothetical protein